MPEIGTCPFHLAKRLHTVEITTLNYQWVQGRQSPSSCAPQNFNLEIASKRWAKVRRIYFYIVDKYACIYEHVCVLTTHSESVLLLGRTITLLYYSSCNGSYTHWRPLEAAMHHFLHCKSYEAFD